MIPSKSLIKKISGAEWKQSNSKKTRPKKKKLNGKSFQFYSLRRSLYFLLILFRCRHSHFNVTNARTIQTLYMYIHTHTLFMGRYLHQQRRRGR